MPANPRVSNGHKRRKARAWALAKFDHCGICGQLIDKSLPAGHPLAPEVDEIIPISKGGSPYDHDNLRLVHRICNEKRGNKPAYAPLKATPRPIKHSRKW